MTTAISNGETGFSVRTKINGIWEGLELNAIAESKAVTAVDVFVYDTSKDSDGGAWRKRTQHTSWYQETLNTATRGSRREFPAVAVIVAETNKVTIYDGDDPSLPMWMVFNTLKNYLPGTFTVGSVYALNGEIACGGNSVFDGLCVIRFPSDEGQNYRATNNDIIIDGGISRRNDASATVTKTTGSIVNEVVNDVAMTILPDAPIDPATGLQVPTIAVATDGGISVIRDDGTVVDITGQAAGVNRITFNADNEIWTTYEYVNEGAVFDIPSADTVITSVKRRYIPNNNKPSITRDTTGGGFTGILDGIVGNTKELSILVEDQATPANGMVAYVTSSWNSGYQNGDIKGAFLSDTDDTDLVGATVEDSQFTGTGATDGWTVQATATNNNGVDQLNITTGATSNVAADKTITGLTVGAWYKVQMTRVSTGENSAVFAGASGSAYGTIGVAELMFKATATSQALQIRAGGAVENISIDNISVKLADADRSVNG